MIKSQIRKDIKQLRLSLSPQEIAAASKRIAEFVISAPWYVNAKTLMLYLPIKNEADTSYIMSHALQNGKTVALPITNHADFSLSCACITSSDDLTDGVFNTKEPDAAKAKPILPSEIDLVIVPALAFDRCGFRVGYGKGCYDRFLPSVRPDCVKAGINYSFAIVDKIEASPHDVRMDYIITENEIIIPADAIFD